MGNIIFYFCFLLLLMVTSVYAENLTLKGSYHTGTIYVPASFEVTGNNNIYYNIIVDKYTERELKIIKNLLEICSSSDGKECEIVANVTKLSPDDIAYGNITDIKYINGLKSDEIINKQDNYSVNKYNECLKSSKKLLETSSKSTDLMEKAKTILNKDEMDRLRVDFGEIFSTKENNQAERISKDKNISLCEAYVELSKDFIHKTESYLNQKISKNNLDNKSMILSNNIINCSEFKRLNRSPSFFDKRLFDDTYVLPKNFDIDSVIINDDFNVPFVHNVDESGDFHRERDIFFDKGNIQSLGNLITIHYLYKRYRKITIKDKNGHMCVITNKSSY